MKRVLLLLLLAGFAAALPAAECWREGCDGYHLFDHAREAVWRTPVQPLRLGDGGGSGGGMAHSLASGAMADGERLQRLLVMQPGWRASGYIEGRFPYRLVGEGERFHATLGLLRGAPADAGASFELLLTDGGRVVSLRRITLTGQQRTELRVDLVPWRGRRVALILRVAPVNGRRVAAAAWGDPVVEVRR